MRDLDLPPILTRALAALLVALRAIGQRRLAENIEQDRRHATTLGQALLDANRSLAQRSWDLRWRPARDDDAETRAHAIGVEAIGADTVALAAGWLSSAVRAAVSLGNPDDGERMAGVALRLLALTEMQALVDALPPCSDCGAPGTRLYEREGAEPRVLCDDCHNGSWRAEDLPYAEAMRTYCAKVK